MKAIITFVAVAALVGVIAVLIFPVFAQAKESAKKTALQSRVKQLETQLAMAKDDGFRTGDQADQPALTTASLVAAPRAVVRKAAVRIRVESIDPSEKKLQAFVRSLHGYVDSEEATDLSSDEPQLTIKMRVPQESFDAAMGQIEALGVRLSKSMSAEDVTEQIVDMDARLKTMTAQEETYREILKTQRGVQGVLDVQDRIMKLREEIESIAAQRKSLAGLAELSTIEVTLVQKADIAVAASGDPNWFGQAWAQAWTAGLAAFRGLTVLLIWLLVFSPAWLSVLIVYRFARRPAKA